VPAGVTGTTARSRVAWVAAALGALFAGMVAWALFAVERPETEARATQERQSRVLSFSPGEVVAIAIAPRSGAEVRVARSGDGWRLVAPSPGPARALAVEGFLDRLGAMRVRSSMPAGSALAPLGLAPPVSRLSLTLRGGRVLELDLGDENPFDRSRYGRSGGELRVIEGVPPAAADPAPEVFQEGAEAR
jgi:hypothetical protein